MNLAWFALWTFFATSGLVNVTDAGSPLDPFLNALDGEQVACSPYLKGLAEATYGEMKLEAPDMFYVCIDGVTERAEYDTAVEKLAMPQQLDWANHCEGEVCLAHKGWGTSGPDVQMLSVFATGTPDEIEARLGLALVILQIAPAKDE